MVCHMRPIALMTTIACAALCVLPAAAQNSDKKLARVKKNADGTITELEEIDKKTIVRRTLRERPNGERVISSNSTYVKDVNGVLRNCKIADGKGALLYTIRYGYHESTGRLIAEGMFDERVKHFNEKGQLIPVQRLYYKYDVQGNRSKPFAITSVEGKTVEKMGSWKKHIKERLDKAEANFGEDESTLSDIERLQRQHNEQRTNSGGNR